MKKFVALTSCTWVVVAQMASLPVMAKEILPPVSVNGLHLRSNYPYETADMLHIDLNGRELGKTVHPVDKKCANKQIDEIKKIAEGLDVDEVQINLEYGNKLNKGNYAQVRKEKPYKIPFSKIRLGERKILEIGVVMPYMPSGPHASQCVIVGSTALKKAIDQPGAHISESAMLVMQNGVVELDQQTFQRESLNAWLQCGIDLGSKEKLNRQQKSCLSKIENIQPAAVSTFTGDKVRKPASTGGSRSSAGSAGVGSAE